MALADRICDAEREPQEGEHVGIDSAMILLVGLPAPCPADVSILIRIGASPPWLACMVAANLNEWPGTTRSSWSPVSTKVAGYRSPGRMLCSGE